MISVIEILKLVKKASVVIKEITKLLKSSNRKWHLDLTQTSRARILLDGFLEVHHQRSKDRSKTHEKWSLRMMTTNEAQF